MLRERMRKISEKVATRRGSWLTLGIWFVFAVLLTMFAPSSKDYSVNNVSKLYPDTSPSVIATEKMNEYFSEDEGIPAIFVFEADEELVEQVQDATEQLEAEEIPYVKNIIPLHALPIEVTKTFVSKDEKSLFLPVLFEKDITSKEINEGLEVIEDALSSNKALTYHVTGPAGIAVDATDLFKRADLVLLFATVGIILILLIFTYRSPFLAFIPLIVAVFVYMVVDRLLGLIGSSGVELASQSLSIMMILLFALVIDYSLFIFSRFREELKKIDDKYLAMQRAVTEIGVPIFYSSSTVLIAMLILFFANFGDYKNFAPIFSVAVFVIMLSALTLLPALFTLVGRNAFWPKIPRVGDQPVATSSIWRKVADLVTKKPVISSLAIILFLIIASTQVFQIQYEYNTMKSFPKDMPSRVGYEVLEEKFSKGALAPTTVILEAKDSVSEESQLQLKEEFESHTLVETARVTNQAEKDRVIQYDLTFAEDPYDVKTIDALESLMEDKDELLVAASIDGSLYFSGETAASVDNRNVNNRDLIVIVILETIFIFAMLLFLTRSFSISSLMMGTILASFVAALGLGVYLSGFIFDVHSISNRVPVYAFVFLVALGIDYNIFLVSRFLEERKKHSVKEAVHTAVVHTGGVISSAGVILAATFAVLITQPVEVLSIFGFIVAIGILMDTFLIRGILMPSLLMLLEKDRQGHQEKLP